MTLFQPIAIVGRGCILPGCASPEALWDTVSNGVCHITPSPAGDWRVDMARVLSGSSDQYVADKAWTDLGGYVGDLDVVLDVAGLGLDSALVEGLDPVFRWSLAAAAQALVGVRRTAEDRGGVVLGNLSYPTRAQNRLSERRWLRELTGQEPPGPEAAPLNRFMSGAPAALVARAFGLAAGSMALDAACASGLYAIKIACDQLQDRRANLMLAGAVNAADQLFLHVGFSALNALSRSGRSRPFHAEADGLIPAEGAAFVALRRLDDALAAGDHIFGVIRGVGLSNDGRSGGFLSPAREGQVRAMRAALAQSGLTPDAVQYVECHATGTTVGDATEIASLKEAYGDRPLVLGSLKANLGHLITASGVAGLVKTLSAMENGCLPATPGSRPLAPSLQRSAFAVLDQGAEWGMADGQRTAAVSSFGFGGNNAHLVVQHFSEVTPRRRAAVPPPVEIVVVGIGLRTHVDLDALAFARRLLAGQGADPRFDPNELVLGARQLAFPPKELQESLGQQLLLLDVARQATARIAPLDPQRTGVYVGMQTDARICRHGVRGRAPDLLREAGITAAPDWLAAALDALCDPLSSASVIGQMPNITANRLSNQFDLRGAGFAVSAEEISGDAALELAMSAIRRGEIATALVGAVDLCREPVHEEAARKLLGEDVAAADAAVMLAIKSRAQAEADGDPILGVIADDGPVAATIASEAGRSVLSARLGHAHAASGLLHVALGLLMLQARTGLDGDAAARPLLRRGGPLRVAVRNRSFLGEERRWTLEEEPNGAPLHLHRPLAMRRYAAATPSELADRIRASETEGEGPCRLAIVGEEDRIGALQKRALAMLASRPDAGHWSIDGISFRAGPMPGEMAFAFTGAASAYAGMGRSLLLSMPDLGDGLQHLIGNPEMAAGQFYGPGQGQATLPFGQLAGSSFLCQLHAAFTLGVLDLRPDASLGLSSGETNAMFAFGIWRDMDGLLADIEASGLYTEALAGRFAAVRAHWGLPGSAKVEWDNIRVQAPVDAVRAAIAQRERAYLTIVNGPADCVIGGDADACRAVLAQLGAVPAVPLGHDLAVHCEAVRPFEAIWRRLHTRMVHAPSRPVRFYSNALDGVFEPTTELVAEALTQQAVGTVDFPRIIERAWADGVRIFVEHGPRSGLTTAIGEILGEREHLAVSLDRVGVPAHVQAWRSAAALWCAGVPVDIEALARRAMQEPASPPPTPPLVRLQLERARPPAPPLARTLSSGTVPTRRLPRPPRLALAASAEDRTAGPALEMMVQRASPPRLTREAQVGATVPSGSPKPVEAVVPPMVMGQDQLLVGAHRRMTDAHALYIGAQREGLAAYLGAATRLQAAMFGRLPPADASDGSAPTALEVVSARVAMQSGPRTAPDAQTPAALTSPPAVMSDGQAVRPGPKFDRRQLEILAGGRVSEVFGPSFAGQDGYAVQVRMPEPPLLLCDRVLGIEGEPHSMGRGTIWTRTEVKADSWYLHHGRMPPGIFIESGQADLLLISWLGVDGLNKGERAYRLLGCELVFHGDLPKPGETLDYEITIDGHANQGDVRLFFFHYDCHVDGQLRISVRNGQAGFFTKKELDASAGVIWSPETAAYSPDGVVAPAPHPTGKTRFSRSEVQAYLDGDLVACFGAGFEWAQTHTRTPATPSDHRNFLGEVTRLDLAGGPAGRGYLRVETDIHGDEWFFDGHFKNDPCMPGTLMADACLQAMAFYMAATGRTLRRDGWRFQPVRDESYVFLCRGQVTPQSRRVVYEIFVDGITDGDMPILRAHVLCTVDGRKAFLCERLGLQLVPDWPLTSRSEAFDDLADDPRPLARIGEFPLDHRSLLHCAWGQPSLAFGEGFARYDGPVRSPRLPGPPYHFMTRIVALQGEMASMKAGAKVTALYDIPPDAWYFAANASPTMPYCVLMEVALQPCGWLASYTLDRPAAAPELLFRNLDGDAVQHREIRPGDRTVATEVELLSLDRVGDLIIEKFAVRCSIGDDEVLRVETVFGFFPPAAMENQKGFRVTDDDLARLHRPSAVSIDLRDRPLALLGGGAARLPDPNLLMIDRVSGYWPEGGEKGLGAIRVEKDVRPGDWFFKAHFFQDPVQPGSLGVEAMAQAMQALMLLGGMGEGVAHPRFEPMAIGERILWHYRGQVTPDRSKVTVEFEVEERGQGPRGSFVIGQARLWCDGLLIYRAPRIGMRIVEGAPSPSDVARAKQTTSRVSDLKDGALTSRAPLLAGRTSPIPSSLGQAIRVDAPDPAPGADSAREVAAAERATEVLRVRPGQILMEKGACRNLPLNPWAPGTADQPASLDWRRLRDDWTGRMGVGPGLLQDLGVALIDRFVRRVVLADPGGFEALRGRPVLYLANHQTAVESFLFLSIVSSLAALPVGAIAKEEHGRSWIGQIHRLAQESMGAANPLKLLLFDRARQANLLRLLEEYERGLSASPMSLLVHVDGTRARVGGAPVGTVSSVLIDLALHRDLPIVPVRFAGGLPSEPLAERLEFPVGYGQQDIFLGPAIAPAGLRTLPFAERSRLVLQAINGLGPTGPADVPLPGAPAFAASVARLRAAGFDEVQAVLRAALDEFPGLSEQSRRLLDGAPGDMGRGLADPVRALLGPLKEPAQ